jgi:hypothetical protein
MNLYYKSGFHSLSLDAVTITTQPYLAAHKRQIIDSIPLSTILNIMFNFHSIYSTKKSFYV